MKHSKNEVVKCIVGSYMKRRQYCDNESVRKYESPLSRSAETSAISGLVDMESSHPNSIMYKCGNNDPSIAENQFQSLKLWISEIQCKKTSDELKALLFPLLCHLYIEMLTGGHKEEATAFLRTYQSISCEEGYTLLEELARIDKIKDTNEKTILTLLRSSKYQITLSMESIQILKQYLIKKAHIILLQMINSWFDLEEITTEPLLDICEDNSSCQTNGFEESSSAADSDLAKLEEIIRSVNDGPSSPSPLLLYSILNPDESLSCATVSDNSSLLAAGFTTANISLYSLTDDILPAKTLNIGSRIRLAIDVDDVPEDVDRRGCNLMDQPCSSQSTNTSTVDLMGHTGTVQDVAFLAGSEHLVSVGMDKTLRVWNLRNYTCGAVYRGHNYPIWCVRASPLNGFVATGSHDRTARLWSLELNFPLRVFAGHDQDVDCLHFHPNGNYLATGSSDNTIRMWSVDSGELVRVFDGHRAGVMALSFSPDGNQLASAGDDKRVKVWDLRNSTVIGEFKGHTESILGLDWSPNGDFVASCGMDNTARSWPIRNNSNDFEQGTPKVYHLNCNSVACIKYSHRNTPCCIIGIKT